MQLPQCLVDDDADGDGQVEAADFAGGHGNDEGAVAGALNHVGRQAVGLTAEQEDVAGAIADRRVRLSGLAL